MKMWQAFLLFRYEKEAIFHYLVDCPVNLCSTICSVLFHRQWASFSISCPIRESLQPLMLKTRIFWRTAFCQTLCPTEGCLSTYLCRTNIIGRLSVSFTSMIKHFSIFTFVDWITAVSPLLRCSWFISYISCV